VHFEPANGDYKSNIEYCSKQVGDGNARWNENPPHGWLGKTGRMRDTTIRLYGSPATTGIGSATFSWELLAERVAAGATLEDIDNEWPGKAIQHRAKIKEAIADRDIRMQQKGHYRNLWVEIRWGDTGTGKTHPIGRNWGKVLYKAHPEGKWWDHLESFHRVILLDEFRWQKWDMQTLNEICDIETLKLEYKGGSVMANWEIVYICANTDPHEWWPDAREKTKFNESTGMVEVLPDADQHPEFRTRKAFFRRVNKIKHFTGEALRCNRRQAPKPVPTEATRVGAVPDWLPDHLIPSDDEGELDVP
jgi:hypothetical protein